MPNQQHDLYAAERGVPEGRRFETQTELQSFVDGMRESNYWERFCGQLATIECHCRKTDNGGSVGGLDFEDEWGWHGKIEMAPVHMTERTVCHEVAHVVAEVRFGSKSHDPWFARTYLELVSVFCPEAYVPLHESFIQNGIDFDAQTI